MLHLEQIKKKCWSKSTQLSQTTLTAGINFSIKREDQSLNLKLRLILNNYSNELFFVLLEKEPKKVFI